MTFEKYTYYYFVGIGGIGMSAIARYFLAQNKEVYGYDKTQTQLTDQLIYEGITIIFEDNIEELPQTLTAENTLVIYTPAIKELKILEYFRKKGYTIQKRAEALAEITQNSKCIAIAGTHGKTTTTTLLAFLLKESQFPSMAFLGGISENYQTNFLYNDNAYAVVEADEFDKSFLHLSPYYACITSMDADHLDIYQNANEFETTFQQFAHSVQKGGSLFLRKSLPINQSHISYSIKEKANYYASDIVLQLPYSSFNLQGPDHNHGQFQIQLQGVHNIENATAALAMAIELGVSIESLRKALKDFKGIKRRFSTYPLADGTIYIDDYAHHPKEIDAALEAVNTLYPNKKKLFIFQPHLYSRTRDFADDFAESLRNADSLILLDIYPAREKPIEGIDSQMLADKIGNDIPVVSLEQALETIQNSDYEVLVTLGAGNIDTLASQILKNQAS